LFDARDSDNDPVAQVSGTYGHAEAQTILRSGGIEEKDSIVISANKYVVVALKEHRPAEAKAAAPQVSI
jgi:hypothetical protein